MLSPSLRLYNSLGNGSAMRGSPVAHAFSTENEVLEQAKSEDFEDAMRNAVFLGGDADTQAAIAGAIAEAFYGAIPLHILAGISRRLNRSFKKTAVEFHSRFGTEEMIAQSLSLL